ncbi:MAG: hypothetical protein N2556_08825, partial [Anaerolineae bacterium]|nr:hypothetical protein [Anaerolineae bacterium]
MKTRITRIERISRIGIRVQGWFIFPAKLVTISRTLKIACDYFIARGSHCEPPKAAKQSLHRILKIASAARCRLAMTASPLLK